MQNEALRARLESLNRGPLPDSLATGTKTAPTLPKALTVVGSEFSPAGLLRSGEVIETGAGEHLRIRLPLEAIWNGGSRFIEARQNYLRSQLAVAQGAVEPTVLFDAEFAALVAALPERAVMLDLETCGLSGSALFLVGLLRQIEGAATVELLLARNYAEEPAVLESLWNVLAESDVLVTFNGKSFDWPMVLDRSVRHRLGLSTLRPSQHIDILHHARRRWRKQLPNCRLQTLEKLVCRRVRPADIPGHAIPGVYANYVRTRYERDMEIVLYHNAADLVTLYDLAHRLAA
jgi:uncharacterized protein YprB with RNaseH-like and TPR domain